MYIYTVRISGVNLELNMQNQDGDFSNSENPLSSSGHKGDGKAGKHHPAESSSWISPALPLAGTSWRHVCTSDLFPWSHKPLSQKDAATGQMQAFYISLKTSATAKCLRVSEF